MNSKPIEGGIQSRTMNKLVISCMNFKEWIVLRYTNVHTHTQSFVKEMTTVGWTTYKLSILLLFEEDPKSIECSEKGKTKPQSAKCRTNTDDISYIRIEKSMKNYKAITEDEHFFNRKLFFFAHKLPRRKWPKWHSKETRSCGLSVNWYESVFVQRETSIQNRE